jgi:PDZ domain-containing protein
VPVTQDGALVDLVVPNSPASRAGLQPGDRIVEVNGASVTGPVELRDALSSVSPGSSVRVVIRRFGALKTLVVGTEPASDDPKRAVMGVIVEAAVRFDAPVKVTIDAGQVVGPSAGLAFALDIVDELGANVVRQRTIVATGELQADGSVHPIGGIKQKAISARRAHADVFLVPAGQADEARKYAGDVEVEPVATFAEALHDLGVTAPAA